MNQEFDWDDAKAALNLAKHGVPFEEAKTVFADTLSITVPDPDHSLGEERWLIIGLSSAGRLLVVCFAERGDVIRLINARQATRVEARGYERG